MNRLLDGMMRGLDARSGAFIKSNKKIIKVFHEIIVT